MSKSRAVMVSGKVLVLGLDGATFKILKPLVEKFDLPNLSSLINKSASGLLQSVFPPVTAPAWTSFMTGKGPGNHGVVDFADVVAGGGQKIVSSESIKSETIWSILGAMGKKVGLLNIPVTYPPPKVNGFVISGMPTPDRNVAFSSPPSLGRELSKSLGPYISIVPWMKYSRRHADRLLKDLIHCVRQRGKYTTYLMKEHEWDFFMVVFSSTDVIQHALWDVISHLCNNSPDSRYNKYEQLIVEYFQELDNILGKICDLTDDNTRIFVISDHGFGPVSKMVHINNWLSELGLLSYNAAKLRKLNFFVTVKKLISQVSPLSRFRFLRRNLVPMLHSDAFRMCIDWEKTKAFSASFTQQGIYINLNGRQPKGIVEPGKEYEELRKLLISELRKLTDPETGNPVVTDLFMREDVYNGTFLEYAPDIMFILEDGRYQADNVIGNKIFEACNSRMTGTHRMEGIIAVRGHGIKQEWMIENAEIIDLAPTILYSLGIPLPDDMEGKVLSDMFTEDFIDAHPIQYTKTSRSKIAGAGDTVLSSEETDIISQQLRDLGYLD